MKNMVLIGLGKSELGVKIIEKFSHEGFSIFLMGRNSAKLDIAQQNFKLKNIQITTKKIDLNDSTSIKHAFSTIENIDVLIYNAVARRNTDAKELSRKDVEKDFSITVGGAIDCIQESLTKLKASNGSVILTGGGVSLNPSVQNSSMSLDKAALRNYAFSLAKSLQDERVYVGTVTITKAIEEESANSSQKVSDVYWEIYNNKPDKFEVII
ncbi:short-chain dehydrogenase/reductase SDR [Lentilactobacillus farraginis DSM 18382 = JCM 14108]|uniref:Short-chain dehydrogenase/reductase SDR n=2 Tax=Lentilactobacillus farraginis DSM 18382 = JCM 14108 TaxID=1423743 RepID=X0PG63_9LACO|nr:short-chain dehydrogenase/reductase SDR [Lentilactobacillus farraginis DSM 18382 = JCM 14108]